MHISLDKLRVDCGTQSRKEIDWAVVDDYAEKMLRGEIFPPATVFFDDTYYYVTDGHHRYHANKKIGAPSMDCNVIEGTLREAIIDAAGANAKHGKPRSNEDKTFIVTLFLTDFEWGGWSDREIARTCEVSHPFVAKIRASLEHPSEDPRKFVRDGKVHEMSKKEEKVAKKSHLEILPDEDEQTDVEKEELFEAVDLLKAENQALTDQLAVISVSPEQGERDMAQSLIAELRAKIRLLEIELASARQSRDTYQSEKAQLMKQNAMLQKKLKQHEDGK
jgi:ParB-like chromosome segregation protein Spo0J